MTFATGANVKCTRVLRYIERYSGVRWWSHYRIAATQGYPLLGRLREWK